MSTGKVLTKENIKLNIEVKDKKEAITCAGSILVENGYVEPKYIESMMKREITLSTYLGNFVAIPHGEEGSGKYINKPGISLVTLKNEVNFSDDNDYKPVRILFGISSKTDEHLEILSKIAIYISEEKNISKLLDLNTSEEALRELESINL